MVDSNPLYFLLEINQRRIYSRPTIESMVTIWDNHKTKKMTDYFCNRRVQFFYLRPMCNSGNHIKKKNSIVEIWIIINGTTAINFAANCNH